MPLPGEFIHFASVLLNRIGDRRCDAGRFAVGRHGRLRGVLHGPGGGGQARRDLRGPAADPEDDEHGQDQNAEKKK